MPEKTVKLTVTVMESDIPWLRERALLYPTGDEHGRFGVSTVIRQLIDHERGGRETEEHNAVQ